MDLSKPSLPIAVVQPTLDASGFSTPRLPIDPRTPPPLASFAAVSTLTRTITLRARVECLAAATTTRKPKRFIVFVVCVHAPGSSNAMRPGLTRSRPSGTFRGVQRRPASGPRARGCRPGPSLFLRSNRRSYAITPRDASTILSSSHRTRARTQLSALNARTPSRSPDASPFARIFSSLYTRGTCGAHPAEQLAPMRRLGSWGRARPALPGNRIVHAAHEQDDA